MQQPETGIILADRQFPNDNPVLLNNVEQYMACHRWDYLIYLGDMLDMDAISHHAMESGDQRALEGKRLKKDYADFTKMLRAHRKIVGKHCKIYYFLGNHEEWASRLVDKFPGLEGMVEPEYVLPFAELNIELVPYRNHIKIGKLYFVHGDLTGGSYTPVNVAKKIVEIYNRNIVFGHFHTLQSFTKISPAGIDETHTGYAIPCLANTKPDWSRGQPTKWLNGFATFYIREDGAFNLYPVVAIDNKFTSPQGYSFG